MKCNQSRPGFELKSPCPIPATITITPRAPPQGLEESDLWAAWQLFPLDDNQTCHSKDIEWRLNCYITRWRQEVREWRPDPLVTRCSRENSTQWSGPAGLRLNNLGEWERHNADVHKSGGQYIAVLFGLQLPLTYKPFQIKWEVYFFKEVYVRLYSLRQYVFCLYMCIYAYLLCGFTTVRRRWKQKENTYIWRKYLRLSSVSKFPPKIFIISYLRTFHSQGRNAPVDINYYYL